MNVANQITDIALEYPHKRSVVISDGKDSYGNIRYKHYTFIQLEKRINQLAHSLEQLGVKQGDRVLLFVKPSLDLCAITFALFKMGAIPVLIDPGMGRKNFLNAIAQVQPNVLIGIPKVHLVRQLFRKKFINIDIFITTAKIGILAKSFEKNITDMPYVYEAKNMSQNSHAAILFTSGGTGVPKGVVYTHDIFIKQTQMLQKEFGLNSNDVDIPGFPLFALFTLAMGMTSCIPDMDPSFPGKADPAKLIQNINDQGATFVAGSPAIWAKLAEYCLEHRLTLPSVKYLVMFGAPIPVSLHKSFSKILTNGTTYTPYGATECLPIANISGKYILKNTAEKSNSGRGTCVGHTVPFVKIIIIKDVPEAISNIEDCEVLTAGAIGEILVQSPAVTPEYFLMPEKTKFAKVYDRQNNVTWHRMGDVGYQDAEGKLWFCGRKGHVVRLADTTLYSIPTESIFNQHPHVFRSALVKVGGSGDGSNKRAGIIIERNDKRTNLKAAEEEQFMLELLELGAKFNHTKNITNIYLHDQFPVDVRHNIKIDRTKLANWVNEKEGNL